MSYSTWHDYTASHGHSPARSRSQQGHNPVSWDATRKQSTPIRWHPEYGASSLSPMAEFPNTALDTIHEDSLSTSRQRSTPYGSPSILTGEYSLFRGSTDSRRHSDGMLSQLTAHSKPVKRYSQGNISYYKSDSADSRCEVRVQPGSSRSLRTPDSQRHAVDTQSEISDTHHSVTSGRSRRSNQGRRSSDSSPRKSTSRTTPRRQSEPSYAFATEKRTSVASITVSEPPRKSTSRNSTTSHKSRGHRSVVSTSSHRRGSSVKEEPVVLTSIDIPSELLDRQVSLLRRLVGPVVVILVVLALLISLATAVYFAVVLKETQDSHIDFLEATLQFTVAQNERSRDFSTLTVSERNQLKSAYCKQIDTFYEESSFRSHYRGCELNILTNDRIEFKLFFLEPTGESKKAADIVRVLALKAKLVGQEGSSLRQISTVTLNLDPTSSNVDLSLTKRPEDFYGVNSRTENVAENPGSKDFDEQTTQPTSESVVIVSTTSTIDLLLTAVSTEILESSSVDDTVLSRNICDSIRPSEVVAHPSDCGHYVQCEFGSPIARPCSGGLVFDPASSACLKPHPDLPCTEIQPCKNLNGGHFAHPTNCHLFIICDQFKSVMKSCPTELVWDTKSQNCVPRKRGTECDPA